MNKPDWRDDYDYDLSAENDIIETMKKERPITFSGPMVRAILDGTKTQTRRVLKKTDSGRVKLARSCMNWHLDDPNAIKACPYGHPGDRLWVREEHYRFGHWDPIKDQRTKTGRQKWRFVADTCEIRYNGNAPNCFKGGRRNNDTGLSAWYKRLARFMPRSSSRIMLEVAGIRVERLNEISEADAMAEGVDWKPYAGLASRTAKKLYAKLWESINGPGSWAANPWVWVIEFKRIK